MKKIILILSLFGAILFAAPPTNPYVYRVHTFLGLDDNNVSQWGDDYLNGAFNNGEYLIRPIREAVPLRGSTTIPISDYYSDYIAWMPVLYNQTKYKHPSMLAGQYSIYIDVYFPATTPSGSAVFIWERNERERKERLNDKLIKGYAAVTTYGQINYTDGSKLVRYLVPDNTPYHKRITIATCPNNQSQTQVVCTYTAIDIIGYLDYP